MRLMKATRLFPLIGLLALVLVLAIASGALAKSTPVLTTTVQLATASAQAASTTAQAASTAIHASLFVAGLVVGLLLFGLARTTAASRSEGHQSAAGVGRQVTEQSYGTTARHKRQKHVLHV